MGTERQMWCFKPSVDTEGKHHSMSWWNVTKYIYSGAEYDFNSESRPCEFFLSKSLEISDIKCI